MSGCDSDEPIIQYGEPHAAGRDQRGVLVYSLHDKPTIHWQELMSAFQAYRSAMNPNVVRFHMPAFVQIHHWKGIQAQLQRSFSLAFPDKKPATISFFKHESGYRNIDIETRFDNVPAADIVAAAAQHGWKVGHAPLGSPEFVSFLTDALLHPVQLDNIPLNLMNEFILSLPDFFKHFNHPAIEIRIVDVWEMQRKVRMKSTGATHKATTWLYFGSMIVLIEFTKPLPGLGRIYDVVHDWPGWVLWKNKVNVHLLFPGKFKYCQFCKYHAQELEGEADAEEKRHLMMNCTKVICIRCGCYGHFDSHCKANHTFSRSMRQKNNNVHEDDSYFYNNGDGIEKEDYACNDNSNYNPGSYGSGEYWKNRKKRAEGLSQAKAMIVDALAQDQSGQSVDIHSKTEEVEQSAVQDVDTCVKEKCIPGSFPSPLDHEQEIGYVGF
ncbi:related to conserved hypothetical Ustilaginaceae-specific protein [Melanopsichium pennsylvanicum]|uniref:Related to conserved hypothetical Ustilaginaceae-specific protein n=1 Tax=Melanopsichium pennsylvanicum TaxID=63383 RepID=A0AAJ4XT97_9BASI|nr:related to conserved hypothetical Ustilaginaceae-specific protein [Melanopsichium pennsylvanicum]